jgi:hypothetical protein
VGGHSALLSYLSVSQVLRAMEQRKRAFLRKYLISPIHDHKKQGFEGLLSYLTVHLERQDGKILMAGFRRY